MLFENFSHSLKQIRNCYSVFAFYSILRKSIFIFIDFMIISKILLIHDLLINLDQFYRIGFLKKIRQDI